MAQLIKRENSPFWYARYQHRGEDKWVSTKCRSRKDAQVELRRIVALAKDEWTVEDQVKSLLEALGKLPPLEQPDVRRRIAKQVLAEQTQRLRFCDAWDAWIKNPNRSGDPKPSTLEGYGAIWQRLERWIADKNVTYLHELTRAQAEACSKELLNTRVSAATYNQHLRFIRRLFETLRNEAGLIENPFDHLQSKRKSAEEGRRNLTEAELRASLSAAQGNLKMVLTLGLFTGLRLGDAVGLKWSNISFSTGVIKLVPIKTSRLNKKLDIPMHPSLSALLQEHHARAPGDDYLFEEEHREYVRGRARVTRRIQKHFEACGIRTTREATDGRRRRIVEVGFHSLRHSFVSLAAKAGAQQHVLQRLVGHSSPALTRHYTHDDLEQRKDAVGGLSGDWTANE